MGDLIEGGFRGTAKEYADDKVPLLLEGPKAKEQEFVVLVATIIDTAIIMATDERAAAEKYEFSPDLEQMDCAIWALTRAEFNEMVKPAETEAKP